MITPSFALTATERVLPRLALDFTTASLDSRITFTRALNTATVINSSGVITSVNADVPRFDYTLKTGGACKGLLIEETRINFLSSVNLVNPANTTGWIAFGDPAVVFSVVSDTAELTAAGLSTLCTSGNVYKLDNSAGTTNSYAYINTAVTWGLTSVSLTAYMRGNGTARLETQAGTWPPVNHTMTSVYQRYTTVGVTNTSSNRFRVRATAGSVVYFILAQAEVGDFATSVIPNTGTAVTRNADVATMTGTNFSDWYSAGAGGVVTCVLPSTVSGTRPALQFDDATANEVITLRGITTNPELVIVDGGSPQAQIDAGTIAANTAYNLGAAWNTNDCAAAVNGNAAVTDNSATIPTVTQARLGSDGSNYLNGYLQNLRYWPQRIINTEVQAFSK